MMRVCLGFRGNGCGKLVKRGRCPACTLLLGQSRGSSSARGYDGKWRRLSERQRREVPWCQIRLPGCTLRAAAGDHVTPLWAGGKSIRSNVQSACASCNAKKRDLDRKGDPE